MGSSFFSSFLKSSNQFRGFFILFSSLLKRDLYGGVGSSFFSSRRLEYLAAAASSLSFLLSLRLEKRDIPASSASRSEEYLETEESASLLRLPYFGVEEVVSVSVNVSLQLLLGVGVPASSLATAADSASLQLLLAAGVPASKREAAVPDSEAVETGRDPYFVRLEPESELVRLLLHEGL